MYRNKDTLKHARTDDEDSLLQQERVATQALWMLRVCERALHLIGYDRLIRTDMLACVPYVCKRSA